MNRLSTFSLISTAIFSALPMLAHSTPLNITANWNTGSVSEEVKASDEIQKIFVDGAWKGIAASVTGSNINIQASIENFVHAQYNGKILIGNNETESVSIKGLTDNTSSILSNVQSSILIDGSLIDIESNVTSKSSSNISIGSDRTNTVNISSNDYALDSDMGDITVVGETINLSGKTSAVNSTISNKGDVNINIIGKYIAANSASADAIAMLEGGTLKIGDSNTKQVSINTEAESGYAAIFLRGNGTTGPSATITGESVDIKADGQSAVGIWLQNNSESSERPDGSTNLAINAETLKITASQGILAYSNSGLDISGNTEINASEAIVARGNSVVNINTQCSACTTKINGDIVFMTTKTSNDTDPSGKLINAFVNLNLSGANSEWNGRAYQCFKNDSGEMTEHIELDNGSDLHGNVTGFKVALNNGAKWNVSGNSFVNTAKVADGATVNITGTDETQFNIESLVLDNGALNIANTHSIVTAESMSGNGDILLATSTDENGNLQAGTFTAANSANSRITVNVTGANADAFESAESAIEFINSKILIQDSDITKYIEEGDINGAIVESDGIVRQSDNTKLEALKGINAATLVQWRNQVNHLTKRLGDVRQQQGDIGAWARVYGGEYKWGTVNQVDMTSTTIQVGSDVRVGDWIVGGAFSYSDSNFDPDKGNGDLYSVALYGTRMFEKGSYVDFVARYGYIKNDITAGNMQVDFASNAFGLSIETGHMFKFLEQAYVEPQIEVSYGYAQGDNAMASNSVKIEQDDYQNLIGRVGLRSGFNFPEDAGMIYAHVSYSYDFLGDADGSASKDGISKKLDEDLGGGWLTFGIGGQFRLGRNTFAYGELERSTGGDVENPYAFNVGVRHLF